MKSIRVCLVAALALLVTACNIQLKVPRNGHVETLSQAYSCAEGETCYYNVSDLYFDQTFVAVPDAGYRFMGWAERERALCGGSTEPCRLLTRKFHGHPELMALLESDDFYFLDPIFETVHEGPAYRTRYCELLVVNRGETLTMGKLYSTRGLNDCPQEQWDGVEHDDLILEFGADEVILSGPRFWVLDDIASPGNGASEYVRPTLSETVFFNELGMRKMAVVKLPPAVLEGGAPYESMTVHRDTVWQYLPGRRVYQLRDPDGRAFLMQSFSQAVDPDLQFEDLATLGERLNLPEGWTFSSHVHDYAMDLATVAGKAEVVYDEFLNAYQLNP